jgi:predicted 3-demethylubiquinone-9 3-methyltransferase (glyoxalase superfamily)
MKKMSTCLWFSENAEEAAQFYTSIFKDSKIVKITRYGHEGKEVYGRPPAGSVMTVTFEINGSEFVALNGGPVFKFNEAVSFMVNCDTQTEIDELWSKLSADKEAEMCGWLKDKYGVSWQLVPRVLGDMLQEQSSGKTERVMRALLKMKKLNIEALKRAYEGD